MLPESTPLGPTSTATTPTQATISSHLDYCGILPARLTSVLPHPACSQQSGQNVPSETQVGSCFSLLLGPPVASHFFLSKSQSCPMTWPLTASLTSKLTTHPTSLLRKTDLTLPKPRPSVPQDPCTGGSCLECFPQTYTCLFSLFILFFGSNDIFLGKLP